MNHKKPKHGKLLDGFAKYVVTEKEVIHAAQFAQEDDFFGYRKKSREKELVENDGPFELYHFSEAMYLYDNAELTYGRENISHARALLRDINKHGNRKQVAKAPCIFDIETLRNRFPNFKQAIDQIAAATALSKISEHQNFVMKPLLLLGPAGVGKTAFCQAIAKIIDVPFRRIDIAQTTTNAILSGLSLSWSTGQIGEILKYLTTSKVINPILLLDEIDKANGNYRHPIEPTLLTLLEAESAKAFKDEALQLSINCEHMIIFATANDASNMSQPLLSRFDVVNVRKPNRDEMVGIIQNMYQDYLNKNAWGKSFHPTLNEKVVSLLINHTPRKIKAILQAAFGKAALRGSQEIGENDIEILEYEVSKMKIGFI